MTTRTTPEPDRTAAPAAEQLRTDDDAPPPPGPGRWRWDAASRTHVPLTGDR